MKKFLILAASMVLVASLTSTAFAQTPPAPKQVANPCFGRISIVRADSAGNYTRICADPRTSRDVTRVSTAISAAISAVEGRPVSTFQGPARNRWNINGGGYGYGGAGFGSSPAIQSFYGGGAGMLPASSARYHEQGEQSNVWLEGRRQMLEARVTEGQLHGIADGLDGVQRQLMDVRSGLVENSDAIESLEEKVSAPPPVMVAPTTTEGGQTPPAHGDETTTTASGKRRVSSHSSEGSTP